MPHSEAKTYWNNQPAWLSIISILQEQMVREREVQASTEQQNVMDGRMETFDA